jgi:hypothetical protein
MKKYFVPMRCTEDLKHVDLIEVNEAFFHAFNRETCATRKREQYRGRCFCSKKYFWKCDGCCDDCEYHKNDDFIVEYEIISENIVDEVIFSETLNELDKIDKFGSRIAELLMNGYSERECATEIGLSRSTLKYHLNKLRKGIKDGGLL